ncbi:unnamed protein product [Vitrella brassicaformis CCMP3155]|uniref:Uncharacterized protein n=1 Tax=Vitrella brassicaformis (strain CCMP3155) TaxID=1169540 RepID=A0A0G4FN11_VITBC|nr:unnamed protein product [Vitrella brassicaformis CCMP3155]|eukprot:CEM14966.1 unnamed protein product [Vitrella brassicaformis CCMP3155]
MGMFWSRPLWVQEVDEKERFFLDDYPRRIDEGAKNIGALRDGIREKWKVGGHIEIRLILKPGSGKPCESDSVAKVFGECGRDDRDPIRWQKTTRRRSLEDDDDRAPVAVSKLSVVGEVDLARAHEPKKTPIPGPFPSVPPFTGDTQIEPPVHEYLKEILARVVGEANKLREDKLEVSECRSRVMESARRLPTRHGGWRYISGSPGSLAIGPDGLSNATSDEAFAASLAVIVEAKAAKYTERGLSEFCKEVSAKMCVVRSWKQDAESEGEVRDDAIGVLCNGTEAIVLDFFPGYEKSELDMGESQALCMSDLANFLVGFLSEWRVQREISIEEEAALAERTRDRAARKAQDEEELIRWAEQFMDEDDSCDIRKWGPKIERALVSDLCVSG